MGEEEKDRGESRETGGPMTCGEVRDECCRKLIKVLSLGYFAWSFHGLRLRYSK
ncbi:hypothetical protein N665_0014s0066 [Sinapis alba]|nr:hypothetical protein N665_0014s0066 [Sinapis alba]